ncbi:MAG: class I SAM-dependent rRNA methyltransferase [Parachlamydiaceae bacterium]|nr:class I SAM-dependent rRNA methyltransferase [Parachlamydiaceae bacterium]
MQNQNCVILKPGKEKAIRNRHHWIFSGAIDRYPEFSNGALLPVHSTSGDLLGSAYFNRNCNIAGRMVAFDATPPMDAIKKNLDAAIAMRTALFDPKKTNAYRLVNGEGDLLPGLVVDRYADLLVIQLSTLGMDLLRNWIVDYLVKKLRPRSIYEKSLIPSRKEEGLPQQEGFLYGEALDTVTVLENNLHFLISPKEGQKTGFFLDHREMRKWVGTLSAGKRVLNCFSYTGAFSVYANAGHATQVDSVDISASAVELSKHNMALNKGSATTAFYAEDVFQFLRDRPLNYDLIILDPPAFAKRQKDVIAACRGYKDINRLAMQRMPPQSLLLTSSCSYHVDAALFQKVIFQAACEAGKTVRIIGYHRLASDHPINICHPEGDYLKSLLLYIE